MQIVIDISEQIYNNIIKDPFLNGEIYMAIKNGTVLPKRHGDLIDRNSIICDDCICPCGHADECFRLLAPTIIEADKEN